jgi:hypothetical protein
MNAEQKQQIEQALRDWETDSSDMFSYEETCEVFAALLQELVDAPEPEPFGYFKSEPFGWTDCAETDDGAIALYTAPPAPSVPDGWMRAIDEALVVHHIDIADSSDGYEEAKKKLNELLAINSDIARDCSEPPADVARDAERYRWLREERFDKPYAVTNEHMNAVYEGDDLDKAIDAAIERQGGE